MAKYDIPRNFKGEDRILYIFTSKKSLLYTLVGFAVCIPIFLIFSIFRVPIVGIILGLPIVLASYILGSFKIPKEAKRCGGEDLDKYLYRIIKRNRNKVIYTSLKRKEI